MVVVHSDPSLPSTTPPSPPSSSNQEKKSSVFPFGYVIITFPDEKAALSASSSPLEEIRDCYPGVTILASSDPYNRRVGSGGGTLNALERVLERKQQQQQQINNNNNNNNHTTMSQHGESILILHAGGASSRCPTQMVLGKAWTSLPSRDDPNNNDTTTTTMAQGELVNPILLWLRLVQDMFQCIPHGSLVVVASDTILEIPTLTTHPPDGAFWNSVPHDSAVVALTVPAPLSVAKNHGVFISQNHGTATMPSSSEKLPHRSISPCVGIFQKPSLPVLQQKCAFTTIKDQSMEEQQQKAWIDTGVICFLPRAAQALQALLQSSCQTLCCTELGIWHLYNNQPTLKQQTNHHSNNNNKYKEQKQLLYEFAKTRVITSLDLYTHFLHALQHPLDSILTESLYCQQFQHQLQEHVAKLIYQTLSPFSLCLWMEPTGSFCHLGTTRELCQYWIDTTATTSIQNNDVVQPKPISMTKPLNMYHSILLQGPELETTRPPSTSVVLESFLFSQKTLKIGNGTVIEHSFLLDNDSISIGDSCLISGLRSNEPFSKNTSNSGGGGGGYQIPSRLILQEVPLSASGEEFVYMVLGMDDDIKACPCQGIYGRPLSEFLKWANLNPRDLWPALEGEADENLVPLDLYRAKIHPIGRGGGDRESWFSIIFSWLQGFLWNENVARIDMDDERIHGSLNRWKARPRLSLAEILESAHAPTEFDFRSRLSILCRNKDKNERKDLLRLAQTFQHQQDSLSHLRHILLDQKHEAIDLSTFIDPGFDGLVDKTACIAMFHTIDDIINRSFLAEKFDICGRAWMLLNASLTQLVEIHSCNPEALEVRNNEDKVMECLVSLSKDSLGTSANVFKKLELFVLSLARNLSQHSFHVSDFSDFALVRDTVFGSYPALLADEFGLVHLSERYAKAMTRLRVSGHVAPKHQYDSEDLLLDRWILATAPARIDLAGGWSDTPPICFEFGSIVTGLAVSIDGKKPLACRSRFVQNSGRVLLKSEHRNELGQLLSEEQTELCTLEQMEGYNDPSSCCALLKCALVILGLVTVDQITDTTLHQLAMGDILSSRCKTKTPLGLQVVVTSLLPHGSGMGASSILAGCVLASIGKCLGMNLSTATMSEGLDLMQLITALEQELTSGGGFQDQVNGLFGGAKTVSCEPLKSPLALSIDPIQLDAEFQLQLEKSIVLLFTGQTRLAKGILESCLRRWATRNPVIVENVKGLVQNAVAARNALRSSSLQELGPIFSQYWEQKKIMAGEDSGVEPPIVVRICQGLIAQRAIYGASLCGAGGGGFLALIKNENITLSELKAAIHDIVGEESGVTIHKCGISSDGLALASLSECDIDFFDVVWLNG